MIQIDHISKRFGDTEVLRDVSFEIGDAEVFVIVGPSGVGKSVLLKNIIGLLVPEEGHIRIDGDDITMLTRDKLRATRERFGVLFQRGALFDSMDVYENTAFPLRMFADLDEEEEAERVRDSLRLVGLADVASKRPPELSGGQQKRAALARAIVRRPAYLFYDEPFSGLDPETSTSIDQLIQDLAAELQATSVVVTHNMHSVLTIADRVGFLHEGTMHFVGSVEELRGSDDPVLRDFVAADAYQL